ncbi:XRE family transcriptional regulator [Pedobacter ginsenosidimutans]|uniref:XRE family transcriptional regulator n=1 Tax=Pedobacter ginsenosidimutans TaxID=687842 RepID=A0A0T5VVD1_9SPHI|nr:helix-turn-helix transcriptional regulator [Pedobacter ginsenosidimutans]KRT17773.1 XRE family transcriptional regulator [Pedobacter ginsenosidimutans]
MINRIAEVLKEKGAGNKDLVQFLKIEKETVSRWVNNKHQPTVTTLNKIAEFLRVDIRELLHPSDWSESKVKKFESKK